MTLTVEMLRHKYGKLARKAYNELIRWQNQIVAREQQNEVMGFGFDPYHGSDRFRMPQ